jgi:hypothetical protein
VEDSQFNLQKFYNAIVELFEEEDDWAAETLAWWNQ